MLVVRNGELLSQVPAIRGMVVSVWVRHVLARVKFAEFGRHRDVMLPVSLFLTGFPSFHTTLLSLSSSLSIYSLPPLFVAFA
mmetsp:Transcript_8581/g.23002  ORF Transcript_8581/g.23002 Transcript_8581/m.23002 type:complete len:82 (-) Transcript_8581:157-402(-)